MSGRFIFAKTIFIVVVKEHTAVLMLVIILGPIRTIVTAIVATMNGVTVFAATLNIS